MQQKWLEDFIALAECRSFTRAAHLRNVTSPAFGRRIKALEDWVGTALIDHGAFPTQLTEAGQQFLLTARETCRNLEDARAQLSGGVPQPNLLRIATGRTLGHTLFPQWLLKTQTEVGEFRTDVFTGSLHDAVLRLEQGHADLVFCYGHQAIPMALEAKEFAVKVVGTEYLVAVSGVASLGQAKHSLDEASHPIAHLALSPTLALSRLVKTLVPQATQARLQTLHRADFAEPLLPLVRAGLGLAWLPMSLVASDLAKGLLVRAWPEANDIAIELRLVKALANKNELLERVWAHA